MSGAVPTGAMRNVDPYIAVRAQLIARQWDNSEKPRASWFAALAKAGLTGAFTSGDYTSGLAEVLTAAEIFGAYAIPLSFTPAAGAAAALAASDSPRARSLLETMVFGGAPVLPALQNLANTISADEGSGLEARMGADGSITVSGAVSRTRIAVPDAAEADAFLAHATGPDGLVVFVFRKNAQGMQTTTRSDRNGGTLTAFSFETANIPKDDILAWSSAAQVLLDRTHCVVQLGLAAELVGLGGALMIRAGAARTSEGDLADALMDVTLARSLVFGTAGFARPARPHTMGILTGVRSAAANAAINAAKIALAASCNPEHKNVIKSLANRAIVASTIYGAPHIQKQAFLDWLWRDGASNTTINELFSAASAMAGNEAAKPSPSVAASVATNTKMRIFAAESGLSSEPAFRSQHGVAELDLMALVCADAQQQAGLGPAPGFITAAARRTRQKLADCALCYSGAEAALAGSISGCNFLAAHDCGESP